MKKKGKEERKIMREERKIVKEGRKNAMTIAIDNVKII